MEGGGGKNDTEKEVKEELAADMVDINNGYNENERNGDRIQI